MSKKLLLISGLIAVAFAFALGCADSTTLTRPYVPLTNNDLPVVPDTTPPNVTAGIVSDIGTPSIGQTVTLSINAFDNSGGVLTYVWDDDDAPGEFTGTGSEVAWICDTAGEYTITVTVTDEAGNFSTTTFDITVTEEPVEDTTPPTITGGINASATTVNVGAVIDLSVNATDDSGGALTYVWNDGGAGGTFTGTGNAVTYTHSTAGTYTITVAVSDEFNNTAQATIQLTFEAEVLDQFEAIRAAAETFLTNATPTMAAADLFDLINDGDDANDPTIVSVRAAADYATGHIPGAINIPWKTIADPANLATLPTGEPIVDYCYTGHTGQVADTILGILGYDCVNLKFGMTAWTQNPNVRVTTAFRDGVDSNNFPLETTVNTLPATNDLPVLDVTTSEDSKEIARASAEAYLTREGMAPTISAQALFDLINDGDDANDPVIVSVRTAEHYALGHIPGAINIPWRTIANPDNLRMLPTDKQIVTYCYTGHTGQVACTVLNLLGYNAVNLKFGIMSWTEDATVRAQTPFTEGVDSHNYPFEGTALQFELVREAVDAYFDSSIPPTTAAADLFDLINDGDDANDPVIVSVRTAEHYAIGHIPGAINIPWKTIADPLNIALLPTDKPIVTYCYTGHTGQAANTILGVLGYDSTNLKYGMCSWTQDETVRATTPFRDGTDSNDFPLETTGNTLPATNFFPVLDVSTSTDPTEVVIAAAGAYLGREGMVPTITAQALFDLLNDGDDANDPIVVEVRTAEHYALGHVPGSINIPWRQIGKMENLMMLPPDRQIVTYCYTGHTGQAACTALNLLGYNAVNMKFGVMAWTEDATVRVQTPFTEGVDSHDYPLNTGATP